MLNVIIESLLYVTAPADLNTEALSPTSLKLTVIPPKNSAAHYYEVNFEKGEYNTLCTKLASRPPYSCIFKDLKLGTKYTFMFNSGVAPGGLDIMSERKFKSAVTPPICMNLYECVTFF